MNFPSTAHASTGHGYNYIRNPPFCLWSCRLSDAATRYRYNYLTDTPFHYFLQLPVCRIQSIIIQAIHLSGTVCAVINLSSIVTTTRRIASTTAYVVVSLSGMVCSYQEMRFPGTACVIIFLLDTMTIIHGMPPSTTRAVVSLSDTVYNHQWEVLFRHQLRNQQPRRSGDNYPKDVFLHRLCSYWSNQIGPAIIQGKHFPGTTDAVTSLPQLSEGCFVGDLLEKPLAYWLLACLYGLQSSKRLEFPALLAQMFICF